MTSRIILAAAALATGALSISAVAAPEHLATIERECLTQLKQPQPTCTCMRDRASTQLKDGQQAFVSAFASKDKAAEAKARQTLTVQELTEAGSFLNTVLPACRK